MTHTKKLHSCINEIQDFVSQINDGLLDKLSCILYQMPPSFIYNESNLDAVVSTIPSQSVIEFRHQSWWDDAVYPALKKAKITFCNVDFPGLKVPFVSTTDFFYLRLHGNPQLFKSSYSSEQLLGFISQIPENCNFISMFFNNTYYDSAYKNALVTMAMMQQH